ncbi:MAG: Biotin carboxyl carrier protein of acetyl-CoA carboxylase [candidate division WS2 bacterium]|uniref:Biotin carboxyl carrier protein of acetyl-CoA carboxylase n=1 Tax=Psychracetigena formicireducens TaxID=2986056 RepID=A0A9E2F685_PSYF1|nr:Biotin carboxyl carrier protein of acetyl-CoA carboxylase [Candidatus Psychracetigena formicireducens]MBT9145110.1 Biotin carboxyl carrier protein of acetyl-CoA carboxylase [Candidatus Psychracetigena formicireducens]
MSKMDSYLQRLKELIEILKKENLSEISIEDNKFKVSIKRNNPDQTLVNVPINSPQPLLNQEVPRGMSEEAGYLEITSPLVGIVRLTRNDGTPYLKEGNQIKKGQTVCVIEAMKVLNEVSSQVAGKVVRIMVKEKQLVEYGQTMVLVEADV